MAFHHQHPLQRAKCATCAYLTWHARPFPRYPDRMIHRLAIASTTAALALAVFAAPASSPDDLFEWATITHAGNRGYDRPTINP